MAELMETFSKNKRQTLILSLEKELNTEMVRFFLLFKQATLALECFKKPMFHLVAFWRQKLLSHCIRITEPRNINDDNAVDTELMPDSDDMAAIKLRIHEQISAKFTIEPLHVVAAMLDPRQKHRLQKMGITDDQARRGKLDLKALMLQFSTHTSVASYSKSSDSTNSSDDNGCEGSDDDNNAQANANSLLAIDKELLDYMPLKLTQDEKALLDRHDLPQGGLLSWWRGRAATFPHLARVVRSVLKIPASTAKSECNFSDAANTLTPKRNQLSPNTVDTLLFMRSNIRL
ncbi:hypothetical protein AeRB84_004457 [Aphanomyces euteiches]|nr:hypothetical protein AeRB84_004457 [Aphanomyces euteiches]